jgi:hypothetical protein
MRTACRLVLLVLIALPLAHCASVPPVQGCPLIAQKSAGACRVGLPLGWYGDDAWRDQ